MPEEEVSFLDELEIADENKELLKKRGFKDVSKLADAHVNLLRDSSSKVKLPAEDAPEEEWGKFFTRIGASDKAEDYALENLPENADADFLKAMQQLAVEARIPKKQFGKLAEGYLKYESQLTEKIQQAQEAARVEMLSELAKTLGGEEKLKEYVASATSACEQLNESVEGLKDYFEKSGWGDDPMMIKLFNFIGSEILPDGFVKGKGPTKDKPKKSRWEKEFEERYGNKE